MKKTKSRAKSKAKSKDGTGDPEIKGQGVSRREFLKRSALGAGVAGVAAATLGSVRTAQAVQAGTTEPAEGITIPDDIHRTLKEAPKHATFEGRGMSGHQVLARAFKEEGLAAFFCCPGNYGMINAIAAEGIPCYGGRTEVSMCAAADGFIRVTGEIAATSGTEGPGFTNMIMAIGAANAARTPLLVLASNKSISGDDRESGLQQAYQQPTTEGLKKYGKRLITPNRVHEYAGYAFRQLKSGVPGPVHLDIPGEVGGTRFADPSELRDFYDKSKYRSEAKPHASAKDMAKVVEMIRKSERPMIVASAGVFYHKAWEALKRAAEKNDIAVVESGPVRGHFGDEHRLSANTAPDALQSVDLVIFVGQYCMPSVGEYRFNPDVKAIRVDLQAEDLGRNWPLDIGIISDEKAFLEDLADALPRRSRPSWVDELAAASKAFEDTNDEYYQLGLKHSASTGSIHPACMAKTLADFLNNGDIPKEQTTIALGGYGIGRYMRRYLRAYRPGQHINDHYQYGAIGLDTGFTFGAGAAVQQGVGPQAPYKGAPVFGITGDAGIGYSGMEFETLSKYKIPAIVIVYNNNAWGVWGTGSRATRALHMYLFQENVRYDKMVAALGARGEYVTSPEEMLPALQRSYKAAANDGVSTLINCQGKKEFWTNQYPPGFLRNAEPGATSYAH